MKICGAILLAAVILGIGNFWSRKIFIILTSALALCVVYAFVSEVIKEQKTINYIEKNISGYGSSERELIAETEEGEQVQIKVTVPEKEYTSEDLKRVFEEEEANLDKVILGENDSFSNVRYALNLPATGVNPGVLVEWYSSNPGLLSLSGEPGEDIDESGEAVVLSASLILAGNEHEYVREIIVYPNYGKDLKSNLENEINALNTDNASERYLLPESVDGENITWYEKAENTVVPAAALLFAAGILIRINELKKEDERRKKRAESLNRGYSELVTKLLLMLYSGSGVRNALFKITAAYQKKLANGGARSEVFEELTITCREMENGVPEVKAYENMAERCALSNYRNLAVLIIQNRKRGSSGFIGRLEQEAISAFAQKKRRAETDGETASLKLLIPLGMMLLCVLTLMLVPAFLSL